MPLFAAVSVNSTLPLITSAVASFIKLYLLLLFVRVLLTWFPNVDWMGQPWVTLRQACPQLPPAAQRPSQRVPRRQRGERLRCCALHPPLRPEGGLPPACCHAGRPDPLRCATLQVTDPYLNLFRNLIPPLMGQIDFTPIFGFMVLQFLAQVLGASSPNVFTPLFGSKRVWGSLPKARGGAAGCRV